MGKGKRTLHRHFLVGTLIFTVFLLLFFSGCHQSLENNGNPKDETSGYPATEKIGVVATIFPLADITCQIGGEKVLVSTLLPAGASPHVYEPTSGQIKELAAAQLFIYVGAGLDDWAQKLVSTSDKSLLTLAVTKAVFLQPNEHCQHEHGPLDPHVWLDPLLVRDFIAPAIAGALAASAPQFEEEFFANLKVFQEELSVLHAEIAEKTSHFQAHRFISYHSAWGYFARRYGLEEVASMAEFPGKEPSPRWLAMLVELAAELEVRFIFAEPQFNPQAAEVIAAEFGGQVLILDPIGGAELPGRDSYLSLIRYNAAILETALAQP